MQSKATNSPRLSAYHFVLKPGMTNAQTIKHHILSTTIPRNARLAPFGTIMPIACERTSALRIDAADSHLDLRSEWLAVK
jgi:hypothetical protein